MHLPCPECPSNLVLKTRGHPTYLWECPAGCSFKIDTRVPIDTPTADLCLQGVRIEDVDINIFVCPFSENLIPIAKIYMPFILIHFIECTRGGCFMGLYRNCLEPYLDNADVLDYVLRSGVINMKKDGYLGDNGAPMYSELFGFLMRIGSSEIQNYLRLNYLSPRSENC